MHPTHPTQHNASNTQQSDAAMDRDVINQETRDNANSTQRRIQQERTEVLYVLYLGQQTNLTM